MRRRQKANRLFCSAALAIALGIGVSTVGGQKTYSVPTMDEVISGIAAAERKLINVRIESEAFEEQRASSDVPWERTSVSFRSTAWYNCVPRSKARVDVHSEVLRWEQGSSPYGEESYSIGFDGRFGRDVRHAVGPPGQLQPLKKATILDEAPLELRDEWCEFATGVIFSLNFLDSQEGNSASQMLTKMREAGMVFEISRERYQGADCVKLSHIGGFSLWFDLEHGYAFRGRELCIPGASGELVPYKTDIVKLLVEAAPGIWFPAEAFRTTYSPNGKRPEIQLSYRCSQAVANDPKFDEEVFQVPIPSDYIVRDKVSGVVYQKSMAEKLLRSELRRSVDIDINNTTEAPLMKSEDGEIGDGFDATANHDVIPAAAETIVGEVEVTTRQDRGRGILWLLVLLITMVLVVVVTLTLKRLKQT
ncbi:MAG: hypothetical protein GY774_05510 [Planctomycetes bacterium]|nr:hypothetical protein [Planctomycetota bacterium]